jgi:hypothetical protein
VLISSRGKFREDMKRALSFMLNAPTFNAQSPAYLGNMIIAYLGRNVKDYRKNFLRNLEKLDLLCPECGGKTALHDSYDRHVHDAEKLEWIVIQRVICCECGKTHAVIPDFIRPYKHYSASDIEFVLRDMEDGISSEHVETAASISTIKRWQREFREKGSQAAGALKALFFRIFDKTINEIRLSGIKIFRALEYILEQFPGIDSSGLAIGDANLWLTNHMAGVYV